MALTICRGFTRICASSRHHAGSKLVSNANIIPSNVPSGYVLTRGFGVTSEKRSVINIQDEDDFKTRVVDASLPVIVDFHATWCGPCKILGPRLEAIVDKHEGKIIMAKVDIDDNSELAMAFKVQAVPTVMAVKGGKVVDGFMGLKDDDQLKTFVSKVIAA